MASSVQFIRINNKLKQKVLSFEKKESLNVWHLLQDLSNHLLFQIIIRICVDRQIERLPVQTRFLSRRSPSFISFGYQRFSKTIKPPVGDVWFIVPELSAILISNSTKLQTNKQCFLIFSCSALSPQSCCFLLPSFTASPRCPLISNRWPFKKPS